MIVRPAALRGLLRSKGAGQVSESAVIAFAAAAEALCDQLADRVATIFRERNEARAAQCLPSLHRLTDDFVDEALRRADGNP